MLKKKKREKEKTLNEDEFRLTEACTVHQRGTIINSNVRKMFLSGDTH